MRDYEEGNMDEIQPFMTRFTNKSMGPSKYVYECKKCLELFDNFEWCQKHEKDCEE